MRYLRLVPVVLARKRRSQTDRAIGLAAQQVPQFDRFHQRSIAEEAADVSDVDDP